MLQRVVTYKCHRRFVVLMLIPCRMNESHFARYSVVNADNTVYSVDGYHFCFANDQNGDRHLFNFETGYVVIRHLRQCNKDGLFFMLRLLFNLTKIASLISGKKKINTFDKRFIKKIVMFNAVSGTRAYHLKTTSNRRCDNG